MEGLKPHFKFLGELRLIALSIVKGQEFECLNCLIGVQVFFVKASEILLETLGSLVVFATKRIQLGKLVQRDCLFVLDTLGSLGALYGFIVHAHLLVTVGKSCPHARVLRFC